MKTTAVRKRALWRLWSLLAASLLLTTLVVGFLASKRSVDPNLHGMMGFVGAALAIVSHVRQGSGWDFVAVLFLLGAVGLGLMVQARSVAANLHLVLAPPAASVSAGVHVSRGRRTT